MSKVFNKLPSVQIPKWNFIKYPMIIANLANLCLFSITYNTSLEIEIASFFMKIHDNPYRFNNFELSSNIPILMCIKIWFK